MSIQRYTVVIGVAGIIFGAGYAPLPRAAAAWTKRTSTVPI